MLRITTLLTSALVILSFHSFGQNQKLDKKRIKAETFFYTEKFEKARVAYEEILAQAPSDNLSKYRVEICSLLTNAKNKPLTRLESYAKTQGRKDKFYYYWMSKIYFQQSNYKKAIEASDKFLHIKQYRSKEIIQEVKDLKKRAVKIYDYYNDPDNYEVEHLSSNINSNYHESSPVYFREKEELLFLSSRPLSGSSGKEQSFYIYEAKRDGNDWSRPRVLKDLGSYSINNANIEVVRNDGRLFVYADKGGGNLYYSELGGSGWSAIKEFDHQIADTKLESHFYINESEDLIIFAHRNKGHDKDLDLVQSKKSGGQWSKPVPLSSKVNSDLDEDYPFLSEDGKTLYFSSKGHGSIGNYDIFKSELDESTNTWGSPQILKYPMNTPDDDIQFKIDEELNSGYFVSNRWESRGRYDIFFFHESDKVFVEGGLYDGKGEIIAKAEVKFTPKRSTGLLVKSMTDDNGKFKVTLGADDEITAEVKMNNQIIHTQTFNTPGANGNSGAFQVDLRLTLHKEALDLEEEVHEHYDPKYSKVEEIGTKFRKTNKARIGNIYFAVGDFKLPSGHEGNERLHALLETMQHNPKLRFEISGHTDNQGKPEVNLALSEKRAQSVVTYLVSQGISNNRLVAKGYGETKPLASNDDEVNGRELNRRIEVLVLEN